jgi:hypothetical protein
MSMITNTSMALVHCTDDIKQWVLDGIPQGMNDDYDKIWEDISEGITPTAAQSSMLCDTIHTWMNCRLEALMEDNNGCVSMDDMESMIIYVEAYNHYNKAE